ncbi:uncharacterized protein [Clytia hemisphaerica]|uniref:Uncharacterized protein n=3 Tax=Clytia hemisphaerica TaxID=252671 RepID=A0A7M5WQV0_9CNID
MGHSVVNVKRGWREEVVLWIMISQGTGRGKTPLRKFLKGILDEVMKKVDLNPMRKGRTVVLKNCSWDKLGELMAANGSRIFALQDEVMGFFTAHGILSQSAKIAEGRQLRDFLTLYDGGELNRETVTGNCNYNMQTSQFNFFGLNQPTMSYSIIRDEYGISVGFQNRFIWHFDSAKFPTYEELFLYEDNEEVNALIDNFELNLVNHLAQLYSVADNDTEYSLIEEKVLVVEPKVKEYRLTTEANKTFGAFHNEVREVMMKYEDIQFLTGNYGKAKALVLRLSAVVQNLLWFVNKLDDKDATMKESDTTPEKDDAEEDAALEERATTTEKDDAEEDAALEERATTPEKDDAEEGSESNDDEEREREAGTDMLIDDTSMKIAIQIIRISLNQLCIIGTGTTLEKVVIPDEDDSGIDFDLVRRVVNISGDMVSFTKLVSEKFGNAYVVKQKKKNAKFTVGTLVTAIFSYLEKKKICKIVQLRCNKGTGNNKLAIFLEKSSPENMPQELKNNLVKIGMSSKEYATVFNDMEDENGKAHREQFLSKQKWQRVEDGQTPQKRRRLEFDDADGDDVGN